jgi:hypothetical protein
MCGKFLARLRCERPSTVSADSACRSPTEGAAMADQKKPNILVIWGDDIGQSNLSCYTRGLMGYHTPNIDRLAKAAARRRHAVFRVA